MKGDFVSLVRIAGFACTAHGSGIIMKKKLIIGFICALGLSFTMSISAFAADYNTDPGYNLPPKSGSSSGASVNANANADASAAPSDNWNAVASALESSKAGETVTITMNASGSIPSNILLSAKENDVILSVKLNNGLTLTIDPSTIKDNAREIDLNIDVVIADKAFKYNGTNFPVKGGIIIDPAASGEFGFEVSFNLTSAQLKEAGFNGNSVSILHIDNNGRITTSGRVQRLTNGGVKVTISKASFYAIVAAEDVSSFAVAFEAGDLLSFLGGVSSTPVSGVFFGSVVSASLIGSFGGLITATRKKRKN